MKAGDIALSRLMQADGQLKTRPVVLLKEAPPFGDFIACGLSTQLDREVRGFDEVIHPGDPDFATGRLREPSLVRLGFLGTVPPGDIRGRVGFISDDRLNRLLNKLADFLRPD